MRSLRNSTSGVIGVLLVATGGCGDPADVEGTYTMAVTNRDNGCNFANWTPGTSSAGITVAITQEGEDVAATIQGATGGFLALWLGSNVYTGTIDGDELDLDLFGSRPQTSGNCAFTYNSAIHATADGDTMTGRIDYTAAGNGNPDCASIDGCVSYQDFNGTRPPQ